MVEPKPTRVILAGNCRLRLALTVNVACCPTLTAPTSASSTYTHRRNLLRSSAKVNRVTACNEAATALPGSTVRVKIMPSAGALMDALDSVIWSVERAAFASFTPACALRSSAVATRDRLGVINRQRVLGMTCHPPPDEASNEQNKQCAEPD